MLHREGNPYSITCFKCMVSYSNLFLGFRWAQIAAHLQGRTDNEIKNYWHSYLKKKLMKQGIDPATHRPIACGEVQVKNISPAETEPSLPPPLLIRPNEPTFLLSDDPINFSLDNGISTSKALFHPSSLHEFHRAVNDHSIDYSTGLVGHHQCQDTSMMRPSNGCGIGAELVSSYNLASRMMTSLFFNEAITRDPLPDSAVGYQMNGDLENNNGALSWGSGYDNKVYPSSDQFHLREIKSQEAAALKPSPWSQEQSTIITSHTALDFGDYTLTSMPEDFDVFRDL